MCGIAGFWDFHNQRSQAELEHIAAAMAHAIIDRGPDSHGTWTDAEVGLALGHRRLSIVDLSPAGHQPMVSASGRFIMCYNGEVYNVPELHQALPHITFRGYSDTEAILEACEAWGIEQALNKLIGKFVFVLFDRAERHLYLVRDRLGVKPLYWGFQGKTLLFASQLKAFKQHPDFKPQLDRQALPYYFQFNYLPAPHSIFQGIYKLLPGHILRIDCSQQQELKQYWNFNNIVTQGLSAQKELKWSPQEYIERLHLTLSDAVKSRMISDVPLGAFLSGGIDSSTVVALMQEHTTIPVKTYSIGFYEKEYNEADYAKAVAHHLGCEHHELYLHVDEACQIIPKLPDIYDEPFADASQIPSYLIAQYARQHITVSLSGDGGDELFAGYNRYLFTQHIWQKAKHIPLPIRKYLSWCLQSLSPTLWHHIGQLLPHKWQSTQLGDKIYRSAALLDAQDRQHLYTKLVSLWEKPHDLVVGAKNVPFPFPNKVPELDDVAYQQYLDTQLYLPDDILTKVDRATMSVSLEARIPLLDHRVVELAWQLPTGSKLNQGISKWPLRQILNRYLPSHLIDRPKMGFGVPIDCWLRGPLRDWAEGLLDPHKIKSDGLLNFNLIEKRWQEHLSGKYNWHSSLWGILMFQAWQQKWNQS